MKKFSSAEIREKFLDFFVKNDHMVLKDASIVPENDPTLLFINSGMAPIKGFFTGDQNPPCPRLCNVQPCIRTIDIDEIGDKHHLTSFQMLGSWSIGDYFKARAIELAYDFLVNTLEIPRERLFATIFSGDETLGLGEDQEAREHWLRVGMPADHIVACGKEDNFWGPTAQTGPCGPCTEIFFDTGDGPEYVPDGEFDTKQRYIEIWNAGVFMQFSKNADGIYSRLGFTSVDTGAGLERLAMVLGGHRSVYETDLLAPIKSEIISAVKALGASLPDRDANILVDHLRTAAMILSEKVQPSNEGRGYIPRKLIRKCLMIAELGGAAELDFMSVLKFMLKKYANIFPSFEKSQDLVLSTFGSEMAQFRKVLSAGMAKLNHIKSSQSAISAQDAFELVATFGLPLEIISDFAQGNSMNLDADGYKKLLADHKKVSRTAGESGFEGLSDEMNMALANAGATEFVGYDTLKTPAKLLMIFKGNAPVKEALPGDEVAVVLDKTSFYAESGGQAADVGQIFGKDFSVKVVHAEKNSNGTFVHFGEVESGCIFVGAQVETVVEPNVRLEIANNHTATHLLHAALKKSLGENVNQAGSKVERGRLRFDFNFDGAITREKIFEIEREVNKMIRANLARETRLLTISEARSEGYTALFGEKYGDMVRAVSFGSYSRELCGGTHAERTGDIGFFLIINVENIGKGTKRITALTGAAAEEHEQNNFKILSEISSKLQVPSGKVLEKIEKLQNAKAPEKKITLKNATETILQCPNGTKVVCIFGENFGRSLQDEVIARADADGGVAVFAGGTEKKQLLVAVAQPAQKNFAAREILQAIVKPFDGKGGGSVRLASGALVGDKDEILEETKKFFGV